MKKRKIPHHELTALMKQAEASDVFRAFLDWLTDMDELRKKSWETVNIEDEKVKDFLHEMEFEPNNKKRAVIATRLHKSRLDRREAKDRVDLYKSVTDFIREATNKNLIKLMKKTMGDLKVAENYVYGEREYKPRVKEGGDEG